jgi:hypothetical protein
MLPFSPGDDGLRTALGRQAHLRAESVKESRREEVNVSVADHIGVQPPYGLGTRSVALIMALPLSPNINDSGCNVAGPNRQAPSHS